ncbi:chromosome segregation ATPase [Anaerosolibacter carboniphilus]|uniref:Chromosome segregation ATPase n=1 Tax=Anaerosolibacter carboniphilus TaxID=1417629 RepID=A0A841KWY6_9FIRM|nr:DUF3102 domain-containing protein [Anaerosolibacter carboniphilus]MBB6218206.1 chromosome segregation ATPase [Anaerosolibacter carboniphilus]
MNSVVEQRVNLSIDRTPELIAAEINSIKNQTKKMVLYNSIEIGRRLTEAKAMVAHGEWGEWLEKSVDYSKSTANNLMRIFEEYGADQITLLESNSKFQALGNLSYTQAVALLGVPEEEREQFVVEHDLDRLSTRELQKVIKEREEALKIANEKAEEARKLLDEKEKIEAEHRTTERVLRETQNDVKALQEALKNEREKSKLEIEKLQSSMAEQQRKLEEAQDSGDDEEVTRLQASLKELEKELDRSNEKILELERQIKEKPIEVNAETIVEKIPEEIEKELQELREKVNQKAGNSEPVVKFSIYFSELVSKFKDLLGALEEIQEPESKEKYKNAVLGLVNKMAERL